MALLQGGCHSYTGVRLCRVCDVPCVARWVRARVTRSQLGGRSARACVATLAGLLRQRVGSHMGWRMATLAPPMSRTRCACGHRGFPAVALLHGVLHSRMLVHVRVSGRGWRGVLTVSHAQVWLGPHQRAAPRVAPRDVCRANLPVRLHATPPPQGVACDAEGPRLPAPHRARARLRAERPTPVHVCPVRALLQRGQQQPQKQQQHEQRQLQQQQVRPAAAAQR